MWMTQVILVVGASGRWDGPPERQANDVEGCRETSLHRAMVAKEVVETAPMKACLRRRRSWRTQELILNVGGFFPLWRQKDEAKKGVAQL